MKVSIVGDVRGRSAMTILEPLTETGRTIIDDGVDLTTYIADSKTVITQPSPRRTEPAPEKRVALTKRNYNLSIKDGGKIADRATMVLTASPKEESLPKRVFYLDARALTILRQETLRPGRTSEVTLDTYHIEFSRDIDLDDLRPSDTAEWKLSTWPAPQPFKDWEDAERQCKLSFEPPVDFPYGFEIVGGYLIERSKALNIRLSDGLAHVSVYLYNTKLVKLPRGGRSVGKVVNDIGINIYSDLSTSIEQEFLKVVAQGVKSRL
ncbi:MAG: hypothetical protein JST40_13840 [Armatimonadetes bacterium]|nr:hypothetical protein [Armatimonadota bacterium]